MSKEFYQRFVISELNVGFVICCFLARSFTSNFSQNFNPIVVESGPLLTISFSCNSRNYNCKVLELFRLSYIPHSNLQHPLADEANS